MKPIDSVNKPQYLFRPTQVARRLLRALGQPPVAAAVRLPWGSMLRINPRETIGRSLWHQGVHDLEVSEALWRLLEPGDLAIDGGANIGYMSQLMALRVGATGRVLAFEPHPAIYKKLLGNLARLGALAAVVDAQAIALSTRRAQAKLVENQWFAGNRGTARIASASDDSHGNKLSVMTAPLDAFVEGRRVAVLKLDVEGHELQALQGASVALAAQRIRSIVFEDTEPPGTSAVQRFLRSHGYVVFSLGRRLSGPLLAEPGTRIGIVRGYDTPNFLATVEPGRVRQRFAARGWRCLRADRSPAQRR